MTKYYVRVKPQLTGENSVHKEHCPFMDGINMKKYLGEFTSCQHAINAAKKFFQHPKGCPFCTKELMNYSHKQLRTWHHFSLT